jgi:hypothetical protein
MRSTTRRLGGLLTAGVAAALAPLLAAGTASASTASASTASAGTASASTASASTGPASHQLNVGGAAAVRPMTSWFSGTVAAGGTQSWVWNNAAAGASYKVALSPVGASTSADCEFEVTRSWDVQQPTLEREFHFAIKNVGTIACGTNILLSSLAGAHTWSTGGINAGGSKSWTWNNANPLDAAYLPGLNPSGATSTDACQLEVTSQWYVQQPTAEREFRFTVKNVGAIACQGTVLLAQQSAGNSFGSGVLAANATGGYVWHNAPTNLIFLPGLTPAGASATTACSLQITRQWYQQRIKPDGTSTRELLLNVKNVGTISCSATIQLAFFAS